MKYFIFYFLSLLFIVSSNPSYAQEPVKIGAIYSLSSWGALGGKHELDAVRMAVEDINSKGGIKGRPIELLVEDNQSDLKNSVSSFIKLVTVNGINVLLGPNWAEFSEVVAPMAERYKVVMLSSSGYTKDLVINKDYVFTLCPKHEVQVQSIVDFIAERNHKKIFPIYSFNAFYGAIHEAIRDGLTRKGINLLGERGFNPSTHDFRSIISKAKQENVDAIVAMLIEGGDMASFLRQVKELKYLGKIYVGDITYDESVRSNMSVAEGVIGFSYTSTASPEFNARFREKFGEESSYFAPKAYDSVYLIKQAMENCGFSSEEVLRCLKNINYSGVSGKITFDLDGNAQVYEKVTKMFEISEGKVKWLG